MKKAILSIALATSALITMPTYAGKLDLSDPYIRHTLKECQQYGSFDNSEDMPPRVCRGYIRAESITVQRTKDYLKKHNMLKYKRYIRALNEKDYYLADDIEKEVSLKLPY